MRQKRLCPACIGIMLCFLLVQYPLVQAQTFAESNTFGNARTFENGVPSGWETVDGGTVEISGRRYKQGKHSLLWSWEGNSLLRVSDVDLSQVSSDKNSGLQIWCYSEENIGDSIQFKFYDSAGQTACSFYYRINFTGWRGLWIRFREDMTNHRSFSYLKKMEIVAPENICTGHLYFDIVEFVLSVSYTRSPGYQYAHPLPYGEDQEVKDEQEGWVYKTKYPEATLPLPAEVTKEQQNIFTIIQSRFDKWIMGSGNHGANGYYKSRVDAMQRFIAYGVNRFNELQVTKDTEGVIHGPGLFANKSKHGPKFGRDIGEKLCLQLALDYRINGNMFSKDKLMLLFDYMHDQGWAEGSAIETIDHQKLRTAAWAYAVYLMRDELTQTPWQDGLSKLDREMGTLRWLSAFNVLFAPLEDDIAVNVDDFRSTTLFRFIYILMMENDDPRKVQYMNHYTRWINRNLKKTVGWADGIKPDGMGYHHRGPYMNAYSNNGIHIMTQIIYFLRHTPFDASMASKNNLKDYLLNYRIISHYYDVPKGVSGRISGMGKATSMIASMAYLSQCFGQDDIDKELAAAMMRLWNPQHAPVHDQINKFSMSIMLMDTPGEIEAILNVVDKNVIAEAEPEGFWIKPYASMAVFRGDGWFVSVKGTSAYVWDWENGKSENTYGRYDSHGQMEIINNVSPYPSMEHSGYDYHHGWDWCRVPGTTTLNYSLDALKSSTQRVFSPNTFVGGVSHEQSSGVWAMDYNDVHYVSGFHFKKSIFFFEPGLMVCLGSDIGSNQPYRTESTVLQHVLSSSNGSVNVNNTAIGSTGYSYVPQNSSVTIMDNFGKGVYVPDDTHLRIERSMRTSKTMRDKISQGDVLSAWFTHDKESTYEYAILMNTSQDQLDAFASQPVYEVVRHDSKVHMVRHMPENKTAYAIFDAAAVIEEGLIKSSSVPVMAMVSGGNDLKRLSICNPDFGRKGMGDIGDINLFEDLYGPFAPLTVLVELRDSWELESPVEDVKVVANDGRTTTLEIKTHDARNYEFKLVPDTNTNVVINKDQYICVWPNPAGSKIYFTKAEKATVYCLKGKEMATGKNISSIDVSSYANGTYILQLINGQKCERIKFTKY